jgi:hypothetical protein
MSLFPSIWDSAVQQSGTQRDYMSDVRNWDSSMGIDEHYKLQMMCSVVPETDPPIGTGALRSLGGGRLYSGF